MSTTAKPATAADITPQWIVAVASALQRQGLSWRASATAPAIEVRSANTGQWMPLNLPTNTAHFETRALRDATFIVLSNEVEFQSIARSRAA